VTELLGQYASQEQVEYLKSRECMAEGAQRVVYDAVRVIRKGRGEAEQKLVVSCELDLCFTVT
jgi:hypothetical protein